MEGGGAIYLNIPVSYNRFILECFFNGSSLNSVNVNNGTDILDVQADNTSYNSTNFGYSCTNGGDWTFVVGSSNLVSFNSLFLDQCIFVTLYVSAQGTSSQTCGASLYPCVSFQAAQNNIRASKFSTLIIKEGILVVEERILMKAPADNNTLNIIGESIVLPAILQGKINPTHQSSGIIRFLDGGTFNFQSLIFWLPYSTGVYEEGFGSLLRSFIIVDSNVTLSFFNCSITCEATSSFLTLDLNIKVMTIESVETVLPTFIDIINPINIVNIAFNLTSFSDIITPSSTLEETQTTILVLHTSFNSSSLTIDNCSFINISNRASVGGVLEYIAEAVNDSSSSSSSSNLPYNIFINNSVFIDITLTDSGKGGVLYLKGPTKALVTSTLFYSCVSGYGGAIYSLKTSLELTSCTFTSCYSYVAGGAIYFETSPLLYGPKLQNCVFKNNSCATNNGSDIVDATNSGIVWSTSSNFINVCSSSTSPKFVSVSGQSLLSRDNLYSDKCDQSSSQSKADDDDDKKTTGLIVCVIILAVVGLLLIILIVILLIRWYKSSRKDMSSEEVNTYPNFPYNSIDNKSESTKTNPE